MGRLNYRLIFSLLAAGAVLLTLLIPATRPLTQRAFWLLSGTYLTHTGVDESDYATTSGMMDDYRIVLLLRGAGRMSVEGRSFEMARIASQRKDAALWGHVIRETSTIPLGTTVGQKLGKADLLRRNSMAQLALTASIEGRVLAPKNAFFCLSQAVALAKLGRWDEIVEPLEKGAKLDQFDDYTLDIAKRQLAQLYATLNPVLPSDLGGDWSMILMPHISNYRSLAEGLVNVSSDSKRFAAGLALAKIGATISQTQDIPLLKYSGSSIVNRSARSLLGIKIASGERAPEISTLVPKVVGRARALGLVDVASGWEGFESWTPYRNPTSDGAVETVPVDVHPMLATQALFMLAWIAAIGACLWIGSQMDMNFSNVLTGVGLMLAVTSIGLGLVIQPWLLVGWVWGAILMFSGFATVRLPGKKQVAVMLGCAGALFIVAASFFHGEVAIGLFSLVLWLIPFVYSAFIKWVAPGWLTLGLVVLGLAIPFCVVANSLPRSPESFERNMVGSIQTLMILTSFGMPLVIVYVMAFGKLNLNDALRLTLKPIPFFALVAAGAFLWGTRQEMELQAVWTELSNKELPPSYKRVIEEARQASGLR